MFENPVSRQCSTWNIEKYAFKELLYGEYIYIYIHVLVFLSYSIFRHSGAELKYLIVCLAGDFGWRRPFLIAASDCDLIVFFDNIL